MKTAISLLFFVIVGISSGYGQQDSILQKQQRSLLKKSIVPLSLIASGILLSDSGFDKSFNTTTQQWVGDDFDFPYDDYTRYVPIAQLYVANIAGIEAKNHWFDQTKNMAISMVLTDVLTNLLKENIYKLRPNGSWGRALAS